jgi:hypothetical protein
LEADSADGIAVPPELLPNTELLEIEGSWESVMLPAILAKVGCADDGTPDVEIALIN